MKKKLLPILGLILVLALMLAACSTDAGMDNSDDLMVDDSNTGTSEVEENNDSVDSVDGSDDGNSDDMGDAQQSEVTDDEMLALIEEKLAGNHGIDMVLEAEYDRAGWEETIDRMIAYGADIDDDEKAMIIDWLLERQDSTSSAEASDTTSEVEMSDEEMIAFIEEKLDGKHDIDRVLNADHDRAGWEETLDRMIGYGADINDQEKELIINWLLSR